MHYHVYHFNFAAGEKGVGINYLVSDCVNLNMRSAVDVF